MSRDIGEDTSHRNGWFFIRSNRRHIKHAHEIICSFSSYQFIIRIAVDSDRFDSFEGLYDLLEHPLGHESVRRSDSEDILRSQRLIGSFLIQFSDQRDKIVYAEIVLRSEFLGWIQDAIGS